jgi:hypothetical protein
MNLDDEEDGADRRDVQRTKVLRNAKIIAPRRASVIYCTVQNIRQAAPVSNWQIRPACRNTSN